MLRVFRASFYLLMILANGPVLASDPLPWSDQLEKNVTRMESALTGCLQSAQACGDRSVLGVPSALWIEVRWTGSTRIVRKLAEPERSVFSNFEAQRVLQLLGSAVVPQPPVGGVLRAMVLGRKQGWERPMVLIDKPSDLADRSVLVLLDPAQALAPAPTEKREGSRYWVFTSDGEVLYQSEGGFVGSSLERDEHFANPSSTRSFDQLEVLPLWSRSSALGWLALEERLRPGLPAMSLQERIWHWFSTWGVTLLQCLCGLGVLAFAWLVVMGLRRVIRALVARRASQPVPVDLPPVGSVVAPARERIEVMIPKVISGQVAGAKLDRNWTHSVLKSRSLFELGRRVMVCLAEGAESPVVFLEFHRDTGMAIFRDQVGIPHAQVPLSMRIPVSDVTGRFAEQPAFQAAVLARLGVSHFEVLELRSPAGSGLRPQLLGLFILLQPGVKSFESRTQFDQLLAQAGRYHHAILRPAPPQLNA